jgi:phosphoribosyl 1,2-cyclic phosphodiesterase
MQFISFSSGSSGNCYLLRTEHNMLLLDAGLSPRKVKQYLSDYGLSLSDADAILITHDHTDHIKGAGLMSEEYQLPVYATEAVHEGMCRNYCMSHKVPVPLRRFVRKDTTFELGDFRITPFDVPHDSSDCVGYLIEADGVAFCIITDAGHVTDVIRQFVARANYLVLEANHDVDMLNMGPYPAHLKGRIKGERGHLSNEAGARLVAEHATTGLRHLWLCHLSEENNHPELVRKTYEQVFSEYGIKAGLDFSLTVLKRLVPSEMYNL